MPTLIEVGVRISASHRIDLLIGIETAVFNCTFELFTGTQNTANQRKQNFRSLFSLDLITFVWQKQKQSGQPHANKRLGCSVESLLIRSGQEEKQVTGWKLYPVREGVFPVFPLLIDLCCF